MRPCRKKCSVFNGFCSCSHTSVSLCGTKGKTSFKRMRFFLWREINLFEICEMCFARKRTTFGCCEMPAGVRRFISFHIAAKTQYITMHSTLVCEALFHILRQQNISPILFPSVGIYLSKTQIHLFRTPLTL